MWVVMNGDEHKIVKTIEEASELLSEYARQSSPNEVKMITLEEYKYRSDRKAKRGKRS